MKDVDGKELSLGGKVVTNTAGYTYSLKVGKIVGFTDKKVRVQIGNNKDYTLLKFPEQLAIIS